MSYLPNMSFPTREDTGRRMSSLQAAVPGINKHKPIIDIKLNDSQSNAFVPSYTTLEKIEGVASITCPVDVHFQDIHVIFQGSARTYVEKIATSAPTTPRTQAYHNFLRLTQPLEEGALPEDKIARANVAYTLPFTFVVPERLLPQACTHQKDNELIEDAHLQLPPSFGDPMMASDGKTLLDDLAPNMTTISYAIRVMITRPAKAEGSKPGVVADAMKKLRIIPRSDEQPPLRVSDNNEDDYILSKGKSVKKGVFKGKHGYLTMSAAQPAPLRLPYLNSKSTCPTTTMARAELRFDPSDAKAKPPRLGNLWTRLKVATFYATMPLRDFPCKSNAYLYDSQRGIFVETLPLSSRCVESAQWTRHEPIPRRDSAISISAEHTSPSASPTATTTTTTPSMPISPADPQLPYYTSTILVPIDLPQHSKSFVPTFHTCLISRVYALDLVLAAHAPSSSSKGPLAQSTSIHLKLPLQIASEGNVDARPLISAEEAASIARREADRAWVPRSVAPPHQQQQQQPSEQPPSWVESEGRGGGGGGAGAGAGAGAGSGDADPPRMPTPPVDTRGARGSVFQNPRWAGTGAGAASDSEGEHTSGFASPPRRGSSPVDRQITVPEEEDLPPEYSVGLGSLGRVSEVTTVV